MTKAEQNAQINALQNALAEANARLANPAASVQIPGFVTAGRPSAVQVAQPAAPKPPRKYVRGGIIRGEFVTRTMSKSEYPQDVFSTKTANGGTWTSTVAADLVAAIKAGL